MAGKIPQQFIDELITRVDIVDVINGRLPLRKAGRDFMACCPFHDEKTPSFSVSQAKQFYYCFGCGASGTAISFLMEYDHLDFVDAVHELAGQANLEVPVGNNDTDQSRNNHKELYALLERVAKFYKDALKSHENAGTAVEYLKQRGLTGEAASKFGVGFAPQGWDSLMTHFAENSPMSKQLESQLLQTGMLIQKDKGGTYDRFRDRIMYPIHDSRGRVIGFGGRAIGDSKPKYLNSPETPIFQKGQELYGLHQVRKSPQKFDQLIVVEGYMDVIGLAQYGVNNAVATLGTATTKQHLERIYRQVNEVVFCFDGDRAGQEAAGRALEVCLALMVDGRQAKFMFLPEKEDPDSFIREHGKAEFESMIVNSIPLSQFMFEKLAKQADLKTIDGRSRLVELARPMLMKIPGKVFRYMLIEQLAEKVHMKPEKLSSLIDDGAIETEVRKPRQTHENQSRAEIHRKVAGKPNSKNPSLIRKAIRLLLEKPALAGLDCNVESLATLDLPGIDLLMRIIELLNKRPDSTSGHIIEFWRGSKEGRALEKLLITRLDLPDAALDVEYTGVMKQLSAMQIQQEQQRQRQLIESKPFAEWSAEEKLNYGKSLMSD